MIWEHKLRLSDYWRPLPLCLRPRPRPRERSAGVSGWLVATGIPRVLVLDYRTPASAKRPNEGTQRVESSTMQPATRPVIHAHRGGPAPRPWVE
jgi:hypothetical protein